MLDIKEKNKRPIKERGTRCRNKDTRNKLPGTAISLNG